MTNNDILDLIRRCNIRDGKELIPGNAYLFNKKFRRTTLIISKKPGNTGISRDIRTEFTTDLLLSD